MSCNLLLKMSTIKALACLKKKLMYPPMVMFNAVMLKVVGNMTPNKVYPRAFSTSKPVYGLEFSCNRESFTKNHSKKYKFTLY